MEIHYTEFVKSSQHYSELPEPDKPEYAFVGRSNVGKSSLINALCGKGTAKVSSAPGKTRLINHFLINQEWYLVDLPGYGYAKVSKSKRRDFESMIHTYCTMRPNLVSLFVLVDMRHTPQANDLEFMGFLGSSQVPFGIIFTKADKLSKSQRRKNLNAYKKILFESWEDLPPIFITSAEKREGLDHLLAYLDGNMKYFYAATGQTELDEEEIMEIKKAEYDEFGGKAIEEEFEEE